MSDHDLVSMAMRWAADNNRPISLSRAKKLALAVARRIEREEARVFGLCLETTDDFRPATYSDRTGEEAVRRILAELAGTPA